MTQAAQQGPKAGGQMIPDPNPARTALEVATLEGGSAFAAAFQASVGAPFRPENPYPRATPKHEAWRFGFVFAARCCLPAGVSRATIDETVAPGRGRSCRGARHEWSDLEKTVAWCARAALTRAQISALMPRHSRQAVANQLHRMKQSQMSGIRDQASERKAS